MDRYGASAYLAPMSLIKTESGEWEIVLGLEVHAQVISDAKLFSGAPTTFGADPNTQVSLVDAAMPGMLPVINERCVEQAVRTGLGLNAKINLHSVFDRMNAEIKKAVLAPDVTQKFIEQFNMEILTSTPEEFAAYQKSEQERWFKVIKDNDIKGD